MGGMVTLDAWLWRERDITTYAQNYPQICGEKERKEEREAPSRVRDRITKELWDIQERAFRARGGRPLSPEELAKAESVIEESRELAERDVAVRALLWNTERSVREAPVKAPRCPRLRDYQRMAVEKWKESAPRGRRRGIVVMPTGTGKTFVGSWIAMEYLEMGKRVAVIVPTQHLAHQWREHFEKWYGLRPALFYAEEKRESKLTIFVQASAIKNFHRVMAYDLIIIDEVHHYREGLSYVSLKGWMESGGLKDFLGLTATIRHDNPVVELMPIIYKMTIGEAVKRKIVAKVEVEAIPVGLNENEWWAYTEVEEKIREMVRRYGYYAIDRDPDLKRKFMALIQRRKAICSESESKLEPVYEIVKDVEERVLVFSESIATVERLKEYLRARGVKCETYHSKKRLKERRRVLEEWGRSFNVLLAVRSLDEGIDIPEVRIGIIVCSGLSGRQLVQRVGRLVRPREGKVAHIYVIYAQGTFEDRVARKITWMLRSQVNK